MAKEEIMKRLRGKKGTKVKLGVIRRGIDEPLSFLVTRDRIPVTTVDAVYMIRPKVGYIRVGSFGATTYKEFMDGIDKLKKQGMRDLILDLQENGGGYLQAAVDIANEFCSRTTLLYIPRVEQQDAGNIALRATESCWTAKLWYWSTNSQLLQPRLLQEPYKIKTAVWLLVDARLVKA